MNCVKLCIENQKAIFTRDKIPVKINDTDVIIKVFFAGICGTDLHIIQGEFDSKDNIVLGHEVSGIIVDISQKYVHLKIGDRVAVNPNKSCGICIPCKRHRTNFCVEGGLPNTLGIKGDDGGWAEYCKVHVSQVTKIPDNVSLNQGILCEPLSCVIHGIDKLYDLDIGSDILIIGAGIIGLLWSCVLHLLGHRRVIVSEPNIDRRNILSQLDLGYKCLTWSEILEYKKENPTYKVNICIDCSGNAEAMQAVLPLIENGGTFLIFGVAPPEKNLTINPYKLFYNEITVLGVNINTPNTFDRAMSYIESMSERYLQIEKLRFATFPLSKHEEALEAFRSGLYTKIIFTPTSDSE